MANEFADYLPLWTALLPSGKIAHSKDFDWLREIIREDFEAQYGIQPAEQRCPHCRKDINEPSRELKPEGGADWFQNIGGVWVKRVR